MPRADEVHTVQAPSRTWRVSWGKHNSHAGGVYREAEYFRSEEAAVTRYLELRADHRPLDYLDVKLDRTEEPTWKELLP